MADWRTRPAGPAPAFVALLAAAGFGLGFLLHRHFGWTGVAVFLVAFLIPAGGYLLVHRYRYGRWTP